MSKRKQFRAQDELEEQGMLAQQEPVEAALDPLVALQERGTVGCIGLATMLPQTQIAA